MVKVYFSKDSYTILRKKSTYTDYEPVHSDSGEDYVPAASLFGDSHVLLSVDKLSDAGIEVLMNAHTYPGVDVVCFVNTEPTKKQLGVLKPIYEELSVPGLNELRAEVVRILHVSNADADFILARSGYTQELCDYGAVIKVCEQLSVLPTITHADIEGLLPILPPKDMFSLANAITHKDETKVSKLLELILNSKAFDAMSAFGLLARTYRLAFKNDYLSRLGITDIKAATGVNYIPLQLSGNVAVRNLCYIGRARERVINGQMDARTSFVNLVTELMS